MAINMAEREAKMKLLMAKVEEKAENEKDQDDAMMAFMLLLLVNMASDEAFNNAFNTFMTNIED